MARQRNVFRHRFSFLPDVPADFLWKGDVRHNENDSLVKVIATFLAAHAWVTGKKDTN